MQIPIIPDYNSLMHSGCSCKYANFISRKRGYTEGGEYNILALPIMSVFIFVVSTDWGTMHNYPICHSRQFLSVDYNIDYDSPISLN